MHTDRTCRCSPGEHEAHPDAYRCQACRVHGAHHRCTGENTLGTHDCLCRGECYQPSANDIAFTQDLIAKLKDGGVWGWPGDLAVYRIDKTRKRFVTDVPGQDPENRGRLQAVLTAVGWTLE